jgi:hypothetical protein
VSCDVALSAAILLASFNPQPGRPALLIPAVAGATNPLASEPLFADIVGRARKLNASVEAYRKSLTGENAPLPRFAAFKSDITALSEMDMKGHLELAARGTDGDLKCILKGISQDLPKRLADLEAASDHDKREDALKEMSYLLNDNVEVITAPPAPPV